ncbi:MAG: ABC transporter permease [Calditrichaeota bacterium]|nr:MAG: ABC transporter permease [Calditrichota bacterium]
MSATALPTTSNPARFSYWRYVLGRVFRSPTGLIGACIVALAVLVAVFAPQIAPYDPYQQHLSETLRPPSPQHWLGQDDLGRDILSRIIYGTRISLKVGFVTVGVSAVFGMLIGGVAGYLGGWVDEILMRITDILLAFPGILLAIGIMAILGPSFNNVLIALSLVGWKSYARLVRGEVLKEKEREYVQAARALGFSRVRIIFFHLLPNTFNPVLVMATLGMASMIITEAGLSFLGLGTQPPTPSWGGMLSEGRQYLLEAPHLTTFPGLAIMILVLGFSFLGDALRDALDPHIKYYREV